MTLIDLNDRFFLGMEAKSTEDFFSLIKTTTCAEKKQKD